MSNMAMLFDPWSGSWRPLLAEGELRMSFFQPDRRTIEILALHLAMLEKAKAER